MKSQELVLVGAVAAGGALGSVGRYLLGAFIQGRAAPGFPMATLVINVAGSFLLGLILQAALEGTGMSPATRLFLATGFCGGFTTFSTFSYETLRLVEEGEHAPAVAYVALSVGLSVGAALGGAMLARRLFARG